MAFPAVQIEAAPINPVVFGLVYGPRSPLAETRRSASRIAASDATVLLTGETGTGKEVFARFIHASSPRAARPFVPVNCGAIPENLLESELFGYVKGAFTGAAAPRRGRVAMAEGGTLFLDEIGELPLALQVKLLRLLQERTFEPVGSSESQPANFRLVAATNKDLAEEVRAGRFRSDLYYRLFVCPIRLPALRERVVDIGVLFGHFWNRRGESRPVDPEVLRCLESYPWPGNVRELENLVERVSVCSEGSVIRVSDLPVEVGGPMGVAPGGEADEDVSTEFYAPSPFLMPMALASMSLPAPTARVAMPIASSAAPLPFYLPTGPTPSGPPAAFGAPVELTPAPVAHVAAAAQTSLVPPKLILPIDLPTMLRELENAYIDAALVQTDNNKKEAARLLGMGRTTLVEKLRRRNADASGPTVLTAPDPLADV